MSIEGNEKTYSKEFEQENRTAIEMNKALKKLIKNIDRVTENYKNSTKQNSK